MKKSDRFLTGFTLIEILVVVSIIGFITTIVIVSLNSAKEKAKETAGIQQLKQVKNAINMFFSDNGYYPETQEGINSLENLLTGVGGGKVYIPEITKNSQLMYFGTSTDSISCNNSKCPTYSLTLWDSKDSGKMSRSTGISYCVSKGKRLPTKNEFSMQGLNGSPAGNFMPPLTSYLYWFLPETGNIYCTRSNGAMCPSNYGSNGIGSFYIRCVRE